MVGKLALIVIVLTVAHLALKIWIVGKEKEEMPEAGKNVGLWGKSAFAVLAISIYFVLIMTGRTEGELIKWFLMLLIIMAVGFQSFLEWKYLKGSKQYIVSLIVLILGVILVSFLF